MSRRLALLNLVLIAAAVLVGAQAQRRWLEAAKRAPVVLAERVKPVAVPFAPLPRPARVAATDYAAVAQETLFSPDRNPTVVIEVPPPKPMPSLPVAQGVMNLGDGPVVILSPKAGERNKEYRPGESIGEFKVLSVTPEEIVFEWDGKRVPKRLEDLMNREAAAGVAAAPPRAIAAAGAPASVASSPVSAPAPAAAPGLDVGGGFRACNPGDASPAGTVTDGYKKVVTDSPFGKICRWEPAK